MMVQTGKIYEKILIEWEIHIYIFQLFYDSSAIQFPLKNPTPKMSTCILEEKR